jgi:hypothetical protein
LPNYPGNYLSPDLYNPPINDTGVLPNYPGNYFYPDIYNPPINDIGALPDWPGNYISPDLYNPPINDVGVLPDYPGNYIAPDVTNPPINDTGTLPDYPGNYIAPDIFNPPINDTGVLPDYPGNYSDQPPPEDFIAPGMPGQDFIVGDTEPQGLTAPPETPMTTAVMPNLLTPEGNISGSGPQGTTTVTAPAGVTRARGTPVGGGAPQAPTNLGNLPISPLSLRPGIFGPNLGPGANVNIVNGIPQGSFGPTFGIPTGHTRGGSYFAGRMSGALPGAYYQLGSFSGGVFPGAWGTWAGIRSPAFQKLMKDSGLSVAQLLSGGWAPGTAEALDIKPGGGQQAHGTPSTTTA